MLDGPIGLATEIVESSMRGGKALRYTISGAIFLAGTAMIFVVLGEAELTDKNFAEIVSVSLGVVAAILAFGVISYTQSLREKCII